MERHSLIMILLCFFALLIAPIVEMLLPLDWSHNQKLIGGFAIGLITYLPAKRITNYIADWILQ